jgi:hypothetical protein
MTIVDITGGMLRPARASGHAKGRGNEHCVRRDCYGLRDVTDECQRSGGVRKYSSMASRQAPEQGWTVGSSRPDSRMSAATLSAQLMQTPARSIPQPVQLQLDL